MSLIISENVLPLILRVHGEAGDSSSDLRVASSNSSDTVESSITNLPRISLKKHLWAKLKLLFLP